MRIGDVKPNSDPFANLTEEKKEELRGLQSEIMDMINGKRQKLEPSTRMRLIEENERKRFAAKEKESAIESYLASNKELEIICGFIQEVCESPDWGSNGKSARLMQSIVRTREVPTDTPGERKFIAVQHRDYANYMLQGFLCAAPQGMGRIYEMKYTITMKSEVNMEEIRTNGLDEDQVRMVIPSKPSDEECEKIAKQMQEIFETKPFKGEDFFMLGLIKNGELALPEGAPDNFRSFMAHQDIEAFRDQLLKSGYDVPVGYKRHYRLEISLIAATIPESDLNVDMEAMARNDAAPIIRADGVRDDLNRLDKAIESLQMKPKSEIIIPRSKDEM